VSAPTGRVREEQLLSVDLVAGDGRLTFLADQPVDERLSFLADQPVDERLSFLGFDDRTSKR
jgi:hypothetical protein